MILIEIDREALKKAGNKAASIREAQRECFREMASRWHADYLLGHFDTSATSRYRYRARRGSRIADRNTYKFRNSYTGRKLRRFGHERPLVFTGRAMMESQFRDIRADSKKGKAVLSRRFNLRNPNSEINMREEVTRVLPREAMALRRAGARAMKAKLKDLKA